MISLFLKGNCLRLRTSQTYSSDSQISNPGVITCLFLTIRYLVISSWYEPSASHLSQGLFFVFCHRGCLCVPVHLQLASLAYNLSFACIWLAPHCCYLVNAAGWQLMSTTLPRVYCSGIISAFPSSTDVGLSYLLT
jgi:hypothetical protein